MSLKFYLLLPFLLSFFATYAFADDQVPGVVVAVEGDPYYFSEDDFGIKILKYFERPLDSYLVKGSTSENSSIEEISQAYEEASKNITQKQIVSDENRGSIFVITFSGGEIPIPQQFSTFSKFTHLEFDRGNPLVPKNQQYIDHGFELESLPSKDKEWFYENVVEKYINEYYSAEAFDVTVDILTGDSSTLQTWEYANCELISYYPFLDENLATLKFVGEFVSEIREKSIFECDGFSVDFEIKQDHSADNASLNLSQFVPTEDNRAVSVAVSFSGGEIIDEKSFYTISKFVPVTTFDSIPIPNPNYTSRDIPQFTFQPFPILLPGYTIDEKPQFTLESLPSEDKTEYYKFIATYLNTGKDPEPFDVTVDILTGDGTILQTWNYSKCDATNYALFYLDNLLFYKFKQTYGSEIREKTYFECGGLEFLIDLEIQSNDATQQMIQTIPSDDQRAQTFVVHMKSTEIDPGQTSYEFTKFVQITNEELPILIPNAPFDTTPKFYLESLPSKDKQWLYDIASMYINPGKTPEPIDVTIGVMAGNGITLQTWNYTKCKILDYRTFIADSLVTRMFTEQFQAEIRDRVIFECSGIQFNPQPEISEPRNIRPIDFIPNDIDRSLAFTVEFSGGEFQNPLTVYTFDDFEFIKQERTSPAPYGHEQFEYGLQLGSLPSKDKQEFYDLVHDYYDIGKDPEPFDVTVDILTGDGAVLQSWEYSKCSLENYEIFLFDNLLFYKGYGGRGSEIRENTVLDCIGFSVNFTTIDSKGDIQNYIPNYQDRAIMYILHSSGGELTHTRSNEFIQKFNSLTNQDFLIESLPNKQQKTGYEFISKYINPGKTPELFDIQVDLITGDGTILYSIDYSKCEIVNYSVFLNENMAYNKFLPQMKSEIREKGILDCSGVSGIILPEKSQHSRWHLPPYIQTEIGIPSSEIVCKENFELMIRYPTNTTVCVKPDSLERLEERGWQKVSENEKISPKIRPIVPTSEERAISFVTHFQGTEIAPSKTSYTFSKFSPITNSDAIILMPDNPLDSDSKQFYLESLPSKDKQWLYDIASMYINPGKTPEPFEVTVEVVSGNGDTFQIWEYDECEISSYDVYLDDSLLNYKFHDKWQSEIRDRTIFDCGGLKLNYS